MIERYALYETQNLTDRFQLPGGVPRGVKQRYNISPTQAAPVIVVHGGMRTMQLMRWGFVPQGARDMNSVFRYKTFNVRSEDVFKKATWDKAVRTQRCIVPANGFYMWRAHTDGKQPFYVEGPTPIMAFAGMYGTWINPDGDTQGMFTLLTVPSSEDLPGFTSRSPILLDTNDKMTAWLDPDNNDATSLYDGMRTPDAGSLRVRAVGEAVNSVKADGPTLIT